MNPRAFLLWAGVLATGAIAVPAAEIPTADFRDSVIYLSDQAGPPLRAAANDLSEYLKQMAGLEPQIRKIKHAGEMTGPGHAWVLGSLAVETGLKPPATEYGLDGFAYDVSGKRIRFAGESDLGAAFAVADFLELQGVRWFTPGPYGEEIPRRATLVLPDTPVAQTPSLFGRNPWYSGGLGMGYSEEDQRQFEDWCRRNKAKGGIPVECHHMWEEALAANGGRDKLFKEHPEWFGEVAGKRARNQLCLTHPAVVDLFVNYFKKHLEGQPKDVRMVLSISPDDGLVLDESSSSKAWISRQDLTFPNAPDVSDLVFQFNNRVVAKLNQEYPNVRLCCLIYSNFQAGPQQAEVNPRLIGMFAPLSLGRYHAVGDPASPTRRMLGDIVERYTQRAREFAWYDYSFLCPDAMMPFTRLHIVQHDLPYLYEKGLRYWCFETAKNWPNYLPDYYLAAKLTWDIQLDQDRLLEEFYRRYFGPAGDAMREYFAELISAYRVLPFSAGNKEFMGAVFTPERLRKLRGLMDRAGQAVKSDPVRSHRVRMFDLTLQQGERFMAMRTVTNRGDFAEAQRINAEILKGWDEALAFDPLTTNRYTKKYWYEAFYGNHVAQVAGWVQGAQILHRFPDEWPAYFDLTNTGELEGAMLAETPLFRFLKLKTYSACLAEQGWERFRGAIWYRQTFPEVRAPKGRKLCVLFAGIDDTVSVWVDGRALGTTAATCFGPVLLELPALDASRKEHILTARVTNQAINELGTGGIIRPVALLAR